MQYSKVIQEILKQTGLIEISQSDIAKILGVTRQAINTKKRNNSEINDLELDLLSKYYQVNFENVNSQIDSVNLEPLMASCGGGAFVSSNLIYDYDMNAEYAIVKAVGNSMEPTIADGSTCIVKKWRGEQIKDNSIYFFSYGDETFIKRLAKNINEIVIMSDNKRYSDILLKGDELDKIKIYGEIVKNMRDFSSES